MPDIFLEIILSIILFILGLSLIVFTLNSAIRTFVLPRGEDVPLTRWTFRVMAFLFNLQNKRARTYEERDRAMAFFAPVTLLVIPVVWLILIMLGYMFIYRALGVDSWELALTMSGSSLLTLGTTPFISLPTTIAVFSEAMIGIGLMALLISYLPTMYSAFSRRETMVTMLEVRAGTPPSALVMVLRLHTVQSLDADYLKTIWAEWEVWFAELDENHTSLSPLVYFRSPHPTRSWVTAAGTILDTASLILSTVDIPPDPRAQLTIRAGYLALRSIAHFFNIPYEPDPKPDDPISISRQEYDEVYDELKAAGVPLKADREQAWKDFAGWRVNYDTVLLSLARLTQAPYAPWSSDRSVPGSRPGQTRFFRHRRR